jgi:hypothetical protein
VHQKDFTTRTTVPDNRHILAGSNVEARCKADITGCIEMHFQGLTVLNQKKSSTHVSFLTQVLSLYPDYSKNMITEPHQLPLSGLPLASFPVHIECGCCGHSMDTEISLDIMLSLWRLRCGECGAKGRDLLVLRTYSDLDQ